MIVASFSSLLASLAGPRTALHSDLLIEIMRILVSTRTNQIGPPGISLTARRKPQPPPTNSLMVDGFSSVSSSILLLIDVIPKFAIKRLTALISYGS